MRLKSDCGAVIHPMRRDREERRITWFYKSTTTRNGANSYQYWVYMMYHVDVCVDIGIVRNFRIWEHH